jgi:hypothetical protein
VRDADAVQAFLVADEVLRKKLGQSEHCRYVTIRTDPRMPRNVIATGYIHGDITVMTIRPGDPPKVLPIDDPADAGEDPAL